MTEETQWQCDCGRWISTAYHRHAHMDHKGASLSDMIAQREKGLDATEEVTMTHVMRTPQHPTRIKPL